VGSFRRLAAAFLLQRMMADIDRRHAACDLANAAAIRSAAHDEPCVKGRIRQWRFMRSMEAVVLLLLMMMMLTVMVASGTASADTSNNNNNAADSQDGDGDEKVVGRSRPTAAFVFGDSLVDTGTNNRLRATISKADYHPYGVDYPGHIATGRYTNGRLVSDFVSMYIRVPISDMLSVLPRFQNLHSKYKYIPKSAFGV
jgi:hypothetical protein